MLYRGVVQDNIEVFVVIRPACENHRAAVCVERPDGCKLIGGVGLGVCLRRFETAGGSSEDNCLVFAVSAGSNEVGGGAQRNGAHAVLRCEIAEVAHGVFVVACDILVVVGGVDADVHELVCVLNIELKRLCEGVFVAALLDDCSHGHGGDTSLVGSPLERDLEGAACRNGVAGLVNADAHAADGVGQCLDRCVGGLTVEHGGRQGELLARYGGGGAAHEAGNAELEHFADPNGSGDCKVAVSLGYTHEVVAVAGSKLSGQQTCCELGGIVPSVNDLAGVCNDLNLADGIGLVGICHGDLDIECLGNCGEGGAHHVSVDGVAKLKVLVLGRVHASFTDGLVDALLAEVVGDDNITGVVCVAPLALVVILVVGGSDMPALVKSHDVVLIAGVVAACAYLTFAVADLDHVDAGVDNAVPVGEIGEGAEGGAGVVELAYRIDTLGLAEQCIVCLHACVGGLVVERLVVAGYDTFGVEGVDMTRAARPSHLKAADGDNAGVGAVEVSDLVLVFLPALLAVGGRKIHVVQCALGVGGAGGIKVVRVVGECDKLDVCALGQVLYIVKSRVESTRAVGILGVAVQLTEVTLVLCLADDEVPVERCGLAVGASDCDLNIDTAVCHVLIGSVAYLAVCNGRLDGCTVHGHLDRGIKACVYDGRTDGRALLASGLGAGCGHRVDDGRVVLDIDIGCAVDGDVLVVHAFDGDGELIALNESVGDVDGVAAVLVLYNAECGAVTEPCFYVTADTEGGVYGEGQLVVLTDIGRKHSAKVEAGLIHDAVHDSGTRHGVEAKRVDGVVGDIVHGVDLEAVVIVLQPLAVLAVVLCRAAFHLKAADAAGAGANQPIGIFTCGLGVECVVAGAVCAQVAIGLVVEAVVVAVFLNGEHDCAVCAAGLAVLNGGSRFENGRAVGVVVLSSEDCSGVGVIDNDLTAFLGETACGRIRAAVVSNKIELLSEQSLVTYLRVAAPVALVGVPLNVVATDCVLYVEAVGGLCGLKLPCGVDIVQRGAGELCAHGKLLAVCGGEGVASVGVHADRPDIGLGVAGKLAVCDGDGSALIVVGSGVVGGQSLEVCGVEDNDSVACRETGDDAAFLDLEERLSKQSLVAYLRVAAPVALVGVPLNVVAADCIFNVVAAGGLCGLKLPCGVDIIKRGAGELCTHGKLLTVCGGEGVASVGVHTDRPDVSIGVAGKLALCEGHIRALIVVGSGVIGGKSFEVCGVVNNDLVAVIEHCAGFGRGLGIGSFGLDHEIQLLLECIACAGVSAPVVVLGVPLETVFVGAAGVVDIECAALAVNCGELPAVVRFVKRSAGVVGVHGQLLAICVCEAVSAVSVYAERPLVDLGKACELAVLDLDIVALVVESGIFRGQGLELCGVKHHDGVAVLEGAQVGDDAAFTGGNGVKLIKGKLRRVAAGIAGDSGVLVCTEFVCRALVAGKSNGVRALTGKAELAVGEGCFPAVVAGLDAVSVAALGSDGVSAAVFELDAVSADCDRPQQGGVDRNGVFVCGDSCCSQPSAVEDTGGIAAVGDENILTVNKLRRLRDLGRCHGCGIVCQYRDRQQ